MTGREAAATREAAKKLRRENDIAVPLPQQFERRNDRRAENRRSAVIRVYGMIVKKRRQASPRSRHRATGLIMADTAKAKAKPGHLRVQRLYEQVAGRLVEMIHDTPLAVGARLPSEFEIARMFGVSRLPVREAMVALETSGIVSVRSGDGTFVTRRPDRRARLPRARNSRSDPGPVEQFRAQRLLEPVLAAEAARGHLTTRSRHSTGSPRRLPARSRWTSRSRSSRSTFTPCWPRRPASPFWRNSCRNSSTARSTACGQPCGPTPK